MLVENPVFTDFLEKGLKYNFDSGPSQVPDDQAAVERGVNCGAFARLLLIRLGFRLPQSLGPIEMYLPNTYLVQVKPGELAQVGDLAFFGPENIEGLNPALLGNQEAIDLFIKRYPGIPHVAVSTGQYDDSGEPLFIHASFARRGIAIQPLNWFAQFRDAKGNARYSTLLAHKRPLSLHNQLGSEGKSKTTQLVA